jgi:hypothetical protein
MHEETTEVLQTKVKRVLEGGDFFEVLLLSSPVRYRLDKYRRQLRSRLEEAQHSGQTVEVLVDWDSQEILELLGSPSS